MHKLKKIINSFESQLDKKSKQQNKNSEDRKFIKKCFHILWINSANETTPP